MLLCLSIKFKSVCPYILDYFYNSCNLSKVISALAVDCIFTSKLRFPWFFPCRVAFYSFSRQLTQLGSGHKFPPASCGLWFQCQCNFQSFYSAVWICPTCAPPHSQSGIGTVVCPQVFSSLVSSCCLRSGHAVQFHKQL